MEIHKYDSHGAEYTRYNITTYTKHIYWAYIQLEECTRI
jgi:hypothetical protein